MMIITVNMKQDARSHLAVNYPRLQVLHSHNGLSVGDQRPMYSLSSHTRDLALCVPPSPLN